jgi:hypothetical protein
MGSNTIEDIMDAYSGQAPSLGVAPGTASPQTPAPSPPNHRFTPLADPVSLDQVYSWDALNPLTPTVNTPDCVNAKVGFPSIARANGSGNGRIAMSDAIIGSANPWSAASAACSTPTNISGEIDFTRSSSGPASTGCDNSVTPLPSDNCLVYVDFAHDAVAYGYYAPGVADAQAGTFNATTNPNGGAANPNNPADHLTTAQLMTLYSSTTGTEQLTISGQTLTFIACLPQSGSGTENFFVGKIGVTSAQAEAAAAAAHCGGTPTTAIEENGANTFQTNAATALTANGLAAGTGVAVIPFSTGSFIGQENGFGFDRTSAGVAAGVNLGVENGVAGSLPYTGSLTFNGTSWGVPPQNLAPDATFYGGTFGRDLYVILDNKRLNGGVAAVNAVERRIFGFLGPSWNVTGGPQTSGTSGSGAICATGTATTFATSPGPPTISGPAQSYLSLFGFTASTQPCGSETIVPVTPGVGG